MKAFLLGLALAAACTGAAAQSVMLSGSIGNRAILIIDGAAPRTLAPGESVQGVRLVSVQGDQAVVEAGGKRVALRMDQPASVGAAGGSGGGGGNRIVLQADSRGHFVTPGAINGRPVNFLVDTGATTVSMSVADAQRIGLDYAKGQRIQTQTANGVSTGWRIKVDSVRVGDVEVRGVDTVVGAETMPFVLLGNSFMNRFSMRRDADQLVLERRF